MDYASARDIRKAINENIKTIQKLFQNARKMQDSIAGLQNDEDRNLMTENFNSVVSSINSLIKNTNTLFDTLENFMEE